jgi:hypothetical protein
MVSIVVAPHASVKMNTLAALEPDLEGLATCPSCHAEDPGMTNLAVSAGADWQCSRCGSLWDTARLATVAAYAMWLAAHTSSVNPARHVGAAA